LRRAICNDAARRLREGRTRAMRLCRFGDDQIGEVVGPEVIDISALAERQMASTRGRGDPLILAWPALMAMTPVERRQGARYALDDVVLRCPVQRPGKIVAAPVNYKKHIAEANADAGIRYGHTINDIKEAGLFLKAGSALAGPRDPLVVRFPDRRTDYEIELVAVIGRGGREISRENALHYVAGYAVGLDITLRGPEDRSFRKSIDGYAIIGPWLTSADEIADPDALELMLDLNGTRRQHSNTAQMVYGVARLVEFASSFYMLEPGDILFTGTPEGVGPIVAGDKLRACIAGLGEMTVHVVAPTLP
jgi:2,4-didehydro-3-deoxy-L-rhamnonate hydrolase